MKTFTVYTYYWPANENQKRGMVFAYLRYNAPSERLKVYQIEAEDGQKAKAAAIKLRRAEVNLAQ